MKNYRKVDDVSKLKLPITKLEFVRVGDAVHEILLYSETGENYAIRKLTEYSSSLVLYRILSYDIQERYKVSGEIVGVPVKEYYKTELEAAKRASDINISGGKVSVKKVLAKIGNEGAVCGEIDEEPAKADEIPF